MYVQEAPVWKTSYRLVLPDTPKGKDGKPLKKDPSAAADRFTIQGWAIVENTTDDDWKDVTLSLVSGRPVSFKMDLYEPLYVYRPQIPVPMVPGVLPPLYAAGDPAWDDKDKLGLKKTMLEESEKRAYRRADEAVTAGRYAYDGDGQTIAPALSSAELANYSASAQANAKEVGEVFQYELDHPVTVERQRSAMLPIISSGIDGRRVSIYNPGDGGEHPMRGLEITNSTDLQLMPGPISVFDGGSYAGDAQIGHVPAGDKRLLAYAVDLEVNSVHEEENIQDLRKIRIVRGLFEVTNLRQMVSKYTFTNKDKVRGRTLVIEQPRAGGWDLKKPEKPSEVTDSLYRFELSMDAGGSGKFEVVQERVESTNLSLTQFDLPTLVEYSKQGHVSAKVIEAFQEAARLQAAVGDIQRQIADLEKQQQEISTDQGRIRQNMQTIDKASPLYARYLQKLTEQETKLRGASWSRPRRRTRPSRRRRR